MNTATSAVGGSNDSPCSMSPALTHESSQDVVIRENGSSDIHNSSKKLNTKTQNCYSGNWPANHKDEVIFVDLRTANCETNKSEGDRAYPKNGTNGTHKHILSNLEESDKTEKGDAVKLGTMTCGEQNKQSSVSSVPIPSRDSNSNKMGLQIINSQSTAVDIPHVDVALDRKPESFALTKESSSSTSTSSSTSDLYSRGALPKLSALMEKQAELETLARKTIDKIHNLQSMVATRHVRQQLMVLVEHHHKILNLMSKQAGSNTTTTATIYPSSLIDLNSLNHMSTAALVDLVQRMQTHCPSSRNGSRVKSKVATVTMSEKEKGDVQLAAGVMLRNLRELHADLDSDATASSSGGETDDEDVEYTRTSSVGEKTVEESNSNRL